MASKSGFGIRRARILLGVSLLAASTALNAQVEAEQPTQSLPSDTDSPAPGVQSAPVSGAGAVPSAANSPDQPEEAQIGADIVVTALRRATNIQKTPLAISAVGGETLANMGIADSTQLARTTPGLVFRENSQGGSRVILRSIQSAGEPTVGLYYDETTVIGSVGVSNDAGGSTPDVRLFDVQRVEVLRGPQGTLYGAGSMAGTVRLIFEKPKLGEFEGAGQAQVSSIAHGGEGWETQGMINVPLWEDKLAVRAVGFFRKRDGWIDNIPLGKKDVNDLESRGGRLMVRFEPLDGLTLDGLAVIQDTEVGASANWSFNTYDAGGPAYTTIDDTTTPQSDKVRLYSVTANWDVGPVTVTGNAGWQRRDYFYTFNTSAYFRNASAAATSTSAGCRTYFGLGSAPCSPAQLATYRQYVLSQAPSNAYSGQFTRAATQEIRVSNNDPGILSLTAGLYHSIRKTSIFSDVDAADPVTGELIRPLTAAPTTTGNVTRPATIYFQRTIRDELEQTAGFVEGTLEPMEGLMLTAGARYYDYKKIVTGVVTVGNPVIGNAVQAPNSSRADENGWVYKFNASYEFTNDILGYAQASQGFRPGGVNQVIGLPDALGPYDSDSLWNYEVGFKTSFANRKIVFNFDVFQIDWNGIQTSAQTTNAQSNGSTFAFITNAGDVRIRGLEAELTVTPLEGLLLQGSGSYIEAKLREDQIAPAGITVTGAGLKGDFVPLTPKWTLQSGAQYTFALSGTSGLQVLTRADVSYTGTSWTLFRRTNPFQQRIPGFATVGARVGLENEDDGWSVAVFANNLFDKVGLITKAGGALGGGNNVIRSVGATPRTIGLELRKRF